jgi:Ca2+-dependent lipid-binding protein
MDESPNYISDTRVTARQLWRPSLGVLELGIHGANNLLPMKTTKDNQGSTDAYCIAKYGPKWVRTRTIFESFNPRWNEQYTWEVYDPCTVLTVSVFDNRYVFILHRLHIASSS